MTGGDLGSAHYITSYHEMKAKVAQCVADMQEFREVIQDAIVRFYSLQFSGMKDMNIELLQNMVTSCLIKDDLYIFL